MPPIRTPSRVSSYTATGATALVEEEDDGFNPAWALKPDPPFPPVDTFFPESPERPPPPQVTVTHLPLAVRNYHKDASLDGLTWGVLLPLAFVYNAVQGFFDVASTALDVGCRGATAVARASGVVKEKVFPGRFDPMGGRRKGPNTPTKKRVPKDSMLTLPPHMVGATPNVVRQARGERLRGDPATRTPTVDEARKWKLFHETPLSKRPRPPTETPQPGGPGTPWQTPNFEFNTPQRKMLKIGKSKEFAMNVHKGEFREWHKLLKKHGIGTTILRRDLVEKLSFPTNLILTLYGKNDAQGLNSIVKCFSHEGFTTHYKILIPTVKYPPPLKFQKGEVKDIDINAVHQQADGCCKFCRGFSWAGQVEERMIENGAEMPCKSQHKSVISYTAKEKAEFKEHKYDMLFRRWCRESRYDWVFETPRPTGWEIPQDDPRLRHISMLRQQHKATYGAPKMYDADLLATRNQLRRELTRQDLAAKLLIDGIRKENPTLAAKYDKLDLERKRRQVRADWLCIRQVKVIRKDPPKKKPISSKVPTKRPTTSAPAPVPVLAPAPTLAPAPVAEPVVNQIPQKPGKRASHSQPLEQKPAKRVKFAAEPEGPTLSGQKTPAKGILKWTSSVSKPKPSARFELTSQPLNTVSSNNQTYRSEALSSSPPKPPPQKANPKINFAAVPTLSHQPPVKPSGPVFFFGAASKAASYGGGLPASFDPAIIRQQYKIGVVNAGSYWDDLNPAGWKPDPLLTKEENDADRVNFNIQKMTEQQNREKELRAMEIAEENARNPRPPPPAAFAPKPASAAEIYGRRPNPVATH